MLSAQIFGEDDHNFFIQFNFSNNFIGQMRSHCQSSDILGYKYILKYKILSNENELYRLNCSGVAKKDEEFVSLRFSSLFNLNSPLNFDAFNLQKNKSTLKSNFIWQFEKKNVYLLQIYVQTPFDLGPFLLGIYLLNFTAQNSTLQSFPYMQDHMEEIFYISLGQNATISTNSININLYKYFVTSEFLNIEYVLTNLGNKPIRFLFCVR